MEVCYNLILTVHEKDDPEITWSIDKGLFGNHDNALLAVKRYLELPNVLEARIYKMVKTKLCEVFIKGEDDEEDEDDV